MASPRIPLATPGSGHLVLTSPQSGRSKFSSLTASYPLKLLSPSPLPSTPHNLGTCYVLAYGGGLVAGDEISLEIIIEQSAGLLLLTQGSTKVFRTRPGLRPLSLGPPQNPSGSSPSKTLQRMHITVQPNAFLLLLPCAVQPYASSSYHQAQRVHLVDPTASVILLDWFTAGRSSRAEKSEEWEFERYSSLNEVVLGDKVIMRERTVLENPADMKATVSSTGPSTTPPGSLSSAQSSTSLAARMHPYKTYATLLISGPHFHPLLQTLQSLSQHPSQTIFQSSQPNPLLIYSYSPLEKGRAGVLRVAGGETEVVGEFIRGVLERGEVDGLVGKGLWERIW
jgi:urease accessory protein